ncbi:hypothetical protein EJ05DRAFT_476452 [Pseudovirgaria hyperparasitica]|uniref:Uncharacterized protein n=1 Tax=Pseudovirgaria hyperparasitica TaxID=470096 RepID=A0A6A6W841_9PEZI|nr:uncharacterized protein EJ05DRAFT_476452 [Pseudovirgaria hyperparasitica]KAF2758194.1 hypothetical protein EJ05DRAFT_476452 [Pseudovirgaria hyperparasitica]
MIDDARRVYASAANQGGHVPKAIAPFALRAVRTATAEDTIWSEVSEQAFRRLLVELEERTNAVPIDVVTADVQPDGRADGDPACLPLSVEKQVADDFAYLAAVTEGAQSVAAVCVEQHICHSTTTTTTTTTTRLVLRIAGMDVVVENVRAMLKDVCIILEGVAACRLDVNHEGRNEIFAVVVRQHRQKLLGRMRSRKWVKPKYLSKQHKKPLWKDFDNVIHRAPHVYPKKRDCRTRDLVIQSLTAMQARYTRYEDVNDDDGSANLLHLQDLVKATYDFCKLPEIAAFAAHFEDISSPTPQVGAVIKTLRQLEKIGAYWRISMDLASAAGQYSQSFQSIHLAYVTPYAEVPTDIAYESWAKTMHVHAEVQLLVEYAMRKQGEHHHDDKNKLVIIWPRTIGTSKYLCYLCYLFLTEHGGFGTALSSHGRLFDQWTVPDLSEFDAQTQGIFANVLERVYRRVEWQLGSTREPVRWRSEPMTSRQSLIMHVGGRAIPVDPPLVT